MIVNAVKNKKGFFDSYSESLVMPKIIRLESNLFVMIFKIMKLLPAKIMLLEAINRGDITAETIIIETSSGTFALGLGLICAERKLPFKIFSDPAISTFLQQQLQELGGSVDIITSTPIPGAYQKQRLAKLHEYLSQNQHAYWLNQYDNLDNQRAYSQVAIKLAQNFKPSKNLTIVGSVGSGGSTCGIIKTLREKNSAVQLIGVDTFNSVLFGLPDGERLLRGLGNSIQPKNLDHACYDQVHWIRATEAFYHTRLLQRKYGIFMGPTSGAAYQVAKYIASKQPNSTVIFTAPDEGYRYLDTVYNDAWLKKNAIDFQQIALQPQVVRYPINAIEPWSYILWDRRVHV